MTALRWLPLLLLAPVLAQAQDGTLRLQDLIQAPYRVPVSPEVRVGWTVTQTVETQATKPQTISYAVVGEDGAHWWVEHVSPHVGALAPLVPEVEGMMMALRVRKDDGRVVSAKLGRPDSDEPLLELEVPEFDPSDEPEPSGEHTQLELGWGTFACELHVLQGKGYYYRSWVGTAGELRGVLLKAEDPVMEDYELTEPPVPGEARLGDETLRTRQLRYSNGLRFLICDDPVVSAFFPAAEGGLLETRGKDLTLRVTERRTDATPRLRWE